jgi:transposase
MPMKKYYLGADVSKGYCDFVLLDQNQNMVEPVFQLDDTSAGYKHLLKMLKKYSENDETVIFVGFESTGGYENKWIDAIHSFRKTLNIKITHLNPRGIAASEKATLERNKTDKSSAILIAKYLIRFADKISYVDENEFFHLRQRWKFIDILTKQRVRLINYLEKLLYSYNPSLIAYYRNPIRNWLLRVIEKYPTGMNLGKARIGSLSKIPYVTEERATLLKESAKKNPGLASKPIEFIVTKIAKDIKRLDQDIKEQINDLEKHCDSEDMEILRSFKGIDRTSAIGLSVQIGNIDRFETAKKLVGYVGVHPVYRQSGDGTYGMRMSRDGRGEAKKILYMATMSAIRCNNDIKMFYLKKQLQGKSKMVSFGACMHKTLRILFGMLKNRSHFESTVDDEEIRIVEEKLKRKKVKFKDHLAREIRKKRSLQYFDSNAPISAREYKKREDYISYISEDT